MAEVLLSPENARILDGADRAICALALKITLSPHAIAEADIDTLRAVGLSEDNVVDVIACASYRTYANRLNYAFGIVEQEPDGSPELTAALSRLKKDREE